MLAFIMKFVVPLVVCLAILVCPVEGFLSLDEYFCEDEAKQVLMAASVTVVMLLQQQMPSSRSSSLRAPAGSAAPETCA